jgi:ABC-2 type transport system ATP-binding protein
MITPPVHQEQTVIEVSGLRKSFGALAAVSGISFQVSRGEIFGFLGPNGAGKTTTINMLTGLARP